MLLSITGFTPDDKVPGAVAINQFGTGAISVGSIPLQCVLYGNKTSGGTAANAVKQQVTTAEEADTFCGARSELGNMCHAALDIPGVNLFIVPVAEAGGAAAATSTITIGGSWATSGEATFQLDGEIIRVAFAATDTTVTLAGDAVALAINQAQKGRLFCTAANAAGTVTNTTASKGVRQNQHTLFLVDQSKKPSGMTIAIAGGTALSNGGVPFTGGSGTDDVSAALTAMASDQQDYIAAAHNDTTNAGRFETDVNAKAAFDIGLLEQYVLSSNAVQATAIALGQTQMNDALGQCVWVPLGVEHPSRVAARVAALRSVTEGADPNHNYDDQIITGASPQFQSADYPTRTVKKAALNASLTICTTVDGTLRIVRSITSRSLNGSTPDYRCLDSGCATVPIRVRKEVVSRYVTLLKPANPNSGPDLDDNLLPPDGTLTPGVWEADTNGLLQGFEDLGWLQKVAANPAVGQWDATGKRIMGLVPTIVADLDHQLGVVVRQIAS